MSTYFVYVLESEKDGSYYVGYSAHPQIRLTKHNNARKGYTSTKQPWQLIYT